MRRIYPLISMTLFLLLSACSSESSSLTTKVMKGDLQSVVKSTGELKAINEVAILAPMNRLRAMGIYSGLKLTYLIPEGELVDSGDVIAKLDPTVIIEKLKNTENEKIKAQTKYDQARLDTALDLRTARNELVNLKFEMEEAKIKLEQSKYEPKSVQRQTEIELQRKKRKFNQETKNYKTKREQAIAKMTEVQAELDNRTNAYNNILSILSELTIHSPSSGMVNHYKNWSGKKVKKGDEISPWNPNIASLPDFSAFNSKTYINEIDINKIKVGQKVKISFDALPNKVISGTIKDVAQMGEQLPKSDSKVYEVNVILEKTDKDLKPEMTTSNEIITGTKNEALFVPIECLYKENDETFVFKKSSSIEKVKIQTGIQNESHIEVLDGLSEGETLLLDYTTLMDENEGV